MKEKFEDVKFEEVEIEENETTKEVLGDTTWTKVKRTGKKALKVLGLVSLGVVIGVAGASLGKDDSIATLVTDQGEFEITKDDIEIVGSETKEEA